MTWTSKSLESRVRSRHASVAIRDRIEAEEYSNWRDTLNDGARQS